MSIVNDATIDYKYRVIISIYGKNELDINEQDDKYSREQYISILS